MAKDKKASSVSPVDELFAEFSESQKERWGASLYVGGAEESRVICLPVPLVLQSLLQQEGFTLGRFTTVVGAPESCKSAFGYEMCRIHRAAGGGFSIIETEKKDSPELRMSITGYDQRRMSITYVEFTEEWMDCLEDSLTKMKDLMEKKLKPACSIPWCWVIDSLAGVTTRSIGEKIDEEGHAGLVQPQNANIIATFMKRMNHWFDNYPFTVLGINHLKLKPDQYGNLSVRNIQGGYAPRFAESLEIEMAKADKKQLDRRTGKREQGVRLSMQVAKNSMAPHSAKLFVDMLWHMEQVETEQGVREIQRTRFDWDAAAIEMLLKPPVAADETKQIAAIVDIHDAKDRRAWSDALGVPSKSPIPYSELGKILESRQDIKEQLYRPLGIRRRNMFVTGESYEKQRARAAARVVRIQGDGVPSALPNDPQRLAGE